MGRWLRRGAAFFLVIALLVSAGGCWPGEERKVEETVRLYNEKLMLALSRPEPELMKPLTTDREYVRILMYILYQYQKKVIVDARLLKLTVDSVEIKGQKATVKAREEWIYVKRDTENRRIVAGEKKIRYRSTYTLEKKKDRWVVAELKVTEEKGR